MRQRRIVTRMLVGALAFSATVYPLMPRTSEPNAPAALVVEEPSVAEDPLVVVEPLEVESTVIDHNGVAQGTLPEPCSHVALSHAYEELDAGFPATSLTLVRNWAYDYAMERMRVVHVILRDPVTLVPWEADWDPDITEAKNDGSLTEWDDHYFVTHNWSYYGEIILDLQPGDVVTINGESMRVEGIFDYPKDSILAEILVLTGDDATVLQTCVPDEDYNRIVYGHSV